MRDDVGAFARRLAYQTIVQALSPSRNSKMLAVRDAIEAAGATAIYLPTYSPELNPIELWWGDVKRQLRTLAINVQPELAAAVRRMRASLSLDKIAAWFRHTRDKAQFK